MKLNSKVALTGLLAAVALGGFGCSGINASHSVSPATFLLPGLMQVEPPPPVDPTEPLPVAPSAVQFAQVR